jgi:hypothetical protein
VYVPAGVPGNTSTMPVAGSKASCGGTAVFAVKIELPGVAGFPLIVSPLKAFVTAVAPLAPLMPVALSPVATTGAAVTVTFIFAVEQFVGLAISQI